MTTTLHPLSATDTASVAEVLGGHPDLLDWAAYGDGAGGLFAIVVPNGFCNPVDLRDQLRDRMRRDVAVGVADASSVPLRDIDPERVADGVAGTVSRFAEPVTTTESDLATIWRDVLGINALGVEDDFLDLGGDSIGVLEVCIQARDNKDWEIPLEDFFRLGTVRAIAAFIDAREV
jgi:acyl carrier protein